MCLHRKVQPNYELEKNKDSWQVLPFQLGDINTCINTKFINKHDRYEMKLKVN